MTWRWRWPWGRERSSAREAEETLARLERRDPEVERLADELGVRQRANNFSGMVAAAIARVAEGPR